MNKNELTLLSTSHRESQLNCDLIGINQICSLSTRDFLLMEKVKIKETDPELLKAFLPMMISRISGLAGIKDESDDFNSDDVARLVLSKYKSFSVVEIWKAFELERYGSYDYKTEHYGLFNADYVSTVMSKYVEWRRKMKKNHNILQILEALNLEAVPQLESPKKTISEITNYCFTYYKEHKCLPVDFFAYWTKIYKKVFEKDPLTETQIKRYRKIGIDHINAENLGILKKIGLDSFQYKCKRESTRIAVIDRFEQILTNKQKTA